MPPLPQLLGNVRHHRGHHQQQHVDRLIPGPVAGHGRLLGLYQVVVELHQAADDGVPLESLDVLGDLFQRLVDHVAQLAHLRGELLASRHATRRLGHHGPDALQEAADALDAGEVPRSSRIPRPNEHQVSAHGVRAVALHVVVRRHHVAAALAHAQPVRTQDDALIEQPQHRLAEVNHAHVGQRLCEETRVKQVHGRVLVAARVLVHRQPVAPGFLVPRGIIRGQFLAGLPVGRDVRVLVPRRAHERVHGVGLAPCRPAALGARGVQIALVKLQRVFARGRDLRIGRQEDRQVFVFLRLDAALVAVDHRDRRAPVALPADEPVVQLVLDVEPADALIRQPSGDLSLRDVARRAGKRARINHCAVFVVVEHIAIPLERVPHLHRRAVLAHQFVARLAPGHDGRVRFRRVERHDAVIENDLPGQPHDVGPVARHQVRPQHVPVDSDLALTRQLCAIEAAPAHNVDPAPLDPSSGQGSAEIPGDRAFPHRAFRLAVGALDHRDDGQPKLEREREVAIVVGGYAHDSARAIGHGYVVRDPDRDAFTVHRIDRVRAGGHACLLALGRAPLDLGLPACLELVGPDRLAMRLGRQLVDQRVLGRQHHERSAPQRVGPGGEDDDLIVLLGLEHRFRALAAVADPVQLRLADAIGPLDIVKALQLLRVGRDLEVPLFEQPALDRRIAALAAALLAHHLLASQGGVALGAEVDRALLAIGQPLIIQLEEQPLRPLVVLRLAGDRLVLP